MQSADLASYFEAHDGRAFHAIPVINGLLIVANILVIWLGWHPHVGPRTGLFSVITYAFGHADVWHFSGNMIALLVNHDESTLVHSIIASAYGGFRISTAGSLGFTLQPRYNYGTLQADRRHHQC